MPTKTINILESELAATAENTTEYVDLLQKIATENINVDIEKAEDEIQLSLEMSESILYNEGIGFAYQLKGIAAYSKNDFEGALQYYILADKFLADSSDIFKKIKPKANIAIIYTRTKQYREALKIYFEVLDIIKDLPTHITHAQMYINIDVAYDYIKESELGLQYAQKALAISETLESVFGIALSTSNIAQHLLNLGRYEEAIEYLDKSNALCEKLNYNTLVLSNCMKYVQYYMHIKNDERVDFYFHKGIAIAVEDNHLEHQSELYRLLAIHCESKGDYKGALGYYKNYEHCKSQFFDTENITSFNALQLRFDSEKKEAAIKDLKIKHQERELAALKAQMNPHFIFNVLNSIQHLYMKGDMYLANEQMGNFASLIRKILEFSDRQNIALCDEVEALTMYLELESLRFKEDFEYKIIVSEDIDSDEVHLPTMLIQPLLENAIKHGLLHKQGLKKLSVAISLDEYSNQLIVTVTDNGIGRKASADMKVNSAITHHSFSTGAIQKRLELINHQSQITHLDYKDLVDEHHNAIGTEVQLRVAIENTF